MSEGESEPEMTRDLAKDPTAEDPTRMGASHHEEEMPRVAVTRRQAVAFGLFVLTIVGFMYFVLPKLAGVGTTLHHIEDGDGWWIAIGVVLELVSFAGYVVLFRAVFVGRDVHPPDRSVGARATRSRWPAWPPRACSRPPVREALR